MAGRVATPPRFGTETLYMSYEEFLEWTGEDIHAEWVDGEVTVFMTAKKVHQRLTLFLATLLEWYVRQHGGGVVVTAPFEMRLRNGRSAREPDLLLVLDSHADRLSEDRLEGPADLVVEIISDDSTHRDRVQKYEEYEAAGIPEYWLLDPRPGRQQATFFQLSAAGTYAAAALDEEGRYHSTVLPGFWLKPSWFWEDPLPDPDDLKPIIAGQP